MWVTNFIHLIKKREGNKFLSNIFSNFWIHKHAIQTDKRKEINFDKNCHVFVFNPNLFVESYTLLVPRDAFFFDMIMQQQTNKNNNASRWCLRLHHSINTLLLLRIRRSNTTWYGYSEYQPRKVLQLDERNTLKSLFRIREPYCVKS